MATVPPQPGSIEFLHHFVQQGTAGGQVSLLKGPATGVTTEAEILNAPRVLIMFRCILPQNNESRHALLLIRPKINPIQRDYLMNVSFSISSRINGTNGKISGFRPVWAHGHTPPVRDIDTFEKALKVMGEKKNGIMEVVAVQLKCDFCNEMDCDKLKPYAVIDWGIRTMCEPCYLQRRVTTVYFG